MAARLILNADDFGLSGGINRAIAELHAAGVLTSATLMANGPAFHDALAIAQASPSLGIGCHIVLVDGTPVSPPSQIPSLLGPDRRTFRSSLPHFVADLLLGRIDDDEIAGEVLAQVQKLQGAGIAITHLDTHKHTHCLPPVARLLVSLCQRTSFACLRNPFEPAFAHFSNAGYTRRFQMFLLKFFKAEFERIVREPLKTGGTLGIAATGSLDSDILHRLLSALPDAGTYELCCHPGYPGADLDRLPTRLRATRDVERRALLTVIPAILSGPHPPELIHYGNLRQRS